MPDLASIPAPILSWGGAIIVAIIGVYFSRKKTSAEVADKITLAAGRTISEYEKRIEKLEYSTGSLTSQLQMLNGLYQDALAENRHLQNRIASVEENDRITRDQLVSLEKDHERLKEKYQSLKDQVNHNSSPDLRA